MYGSPRATVEDEYAKVRAENDWTARPGGAVSGPAARVLRLQPAQGVRAGGARALRRRSRPAAAASSSTSATRTCSWRTPAHVEQLAPGLPRGERAPDDDRGAPASIDLEEAPVRTRTGPHVPGRAATAARRRRGPGRASGRDRAWLRRSAGRQRDGRAGRGGRKQGSAHPTAQVRRRWRRGPNISPAQRRWLRGESVRSGSTGFCTARTPRPATISGLGESWAAFRRLPLTQREFETIASNVAPYLR